MSKPELSDFMLEIGGKFYPRRCRRFKDLQPYQEACEWARKLDWRQNPYDRFLLHRELLRHLESAEVHGSAECFQFCFSRGDRCRSGPASGRVSEKNESLGVFAYVLVILPWDLGFKHGRIRYSRLTEALAKLPSVGGMNNTANSTAR